MIILIRHGQSTSNERGLLGGRSDSALTPRGRHQACALGPLLDGVGEVWTSPLERARTTAALALPGLVAVVKEAFIEVDYGSIDGRSLSEVTDREWKNFESGHSRPLSDGESLDEVDARVQPELEVLRADPTSWLHRDDEHLVIVSHVSPIKSAVTWALGVEGSRAWRLRIDNGSLSIVGARRGTVALIRANVVPT